ncbi:MAG: hypothetical protein IV090_17150 [Candidatus Sericytochromatia bacterium]|nr:hypothetical protein [Candidatus Sericytochromatia bacterium]
MCKYTTYKLRNIWYNPCMYNYDLTSLIYRPGRHKERFESPFGQQLWAFLIEPQTLHTLVITSRLRHPAVEGIDEDLRLRFEKELAPLDQTDKDNYKRMIGHMIRQIMDNLGYELDSQHLKTRSPNNKLFSSGSRYRRRGALYSGSDHDES